jgi:hypothetical protein
MDRSKFALLAGGGLVFAAVGFWRFPAEATVPAPRPLPLTAPASARAAAPARTPDKAAAPVTTPHKAAAPAETPKRSVSSATVTAAVSPDTAPLEPRRIVRVTSPAAPTLATVSEVVRPRATPRVSPSVTPLDYERRVADAASIGAGEPNRATFRLEHLAAAEPDRPLAYETLAAIYLRQGDFYQAYEMFDAAIRKGGKATFAIVHDHSRGNFEADPKSTCVGELTIQPTEVTFEGADGHRFAASWAELSEAGSNRFFGSRIGGFHVRLAGEGKSRNFNLAPRSRDKREGNIILDLLIENAQRQDAGK